MSELLNCPFCGSHAQDDFIEGQSYIIECYACDASTGCQDSAEDAIAAWNRRAAPAAGTEKDAERLLTAIVRSDVGIATRHKLEDGQGTNTDDGRAWLAAIEFVAAIAAKEPPCST